MNKKLPKRSRDIGRKYVSGWEKKKKKEANEVSTNKQKSALYTVHKFLKRLKPESENMAASSEIAETDSVKNTAVLNVIREEDNDVTQTADQHVVMGNEKKMLSIH